MIRGLSETGSNERYIEVLSGQDSLTDEVLLQICRITPEEADSMPEYMEDLRSIPGLLGREAGHLQHLELAVTTIASVLGHIPRHNPVHLPFGYGGRRLHSHFWIDQATVDHVSKQIVGLAFEDHGPETIAIMVEQAVLEAVRLGFLEQKLYDAWRPGMPSGSGWRYAVMATAYGMTKARASRTSRDGLSINISSNTSAAAAPVCADVEHPTMDHGQDHLPAQVAIAHGDAYEWARQAELVRAANQVLGSGMLNKGVLSRACAAGKVQTNGKPGHGSRVRVSSFLVWVGRQFSLGTDEQIQVRNAVIGEIHGRNS